MILLLLTIYSNIVFAQSESIEPRVKFINDEINFTGLPRNKTSEMIRYGYSLITKTAEIMGPDSSFDPRYKNVKSKISCRNCHIGAGSIEFGNSFLDTHQLYPQYRQREEKFQTLPERINACFTHPMQGKPLDLKSKEMLAIQVYIRWLGLMRPPLEVDPDLRLPKIEFLDRAASVEKGHKIFTSLCIQCHGVDGQGQLNPNKLSYKYPPLWGKESFVYGSSMSRISVLARFIKGNMPYMSQKKATVEEAWDLAAYVLSHNRPAWNGKSEPFKDLSQKAFDFPFGPYGDHFSAEQHKLGPYKPIIDYWVKKNNINYLGPSGI